MEHTKEKRVIESLGAIMVPHNIEEFKGCRFWFQTAGRKKQMLLLKILYNTTVLPNQLVPLLPPYRVDRRLVEPLFLHTHLAASDPWSLPGLVVAIVLHVDVSGAN